jgi:hypothetical protein
VIFAQDTHPEVKEALGELLRHRQAQATRLDERRYREFVGSDGCRPGETKNAFLARHGKGPGPAEPDKMPYYLLLVGDPEAIPYRFQDQLDLQYAVGRICFDTLEEYAAYAHSVVEAETAGRLRPSVATFFGASNAYDQATRVSANHLLEPLAQQLTESLPNWTIEKVLGNDTTKARLGQLLGGSESPSFLFTASHGVAFPSGDRRQLPHQGALLCHDWPGPVRWRRPIPPDFYFAADDVGDEANLLGMVVLLLASYSAGAPAFDEFQAQVFREQVAIAPHAFVARLPQRLLGHPKGGALCVIGHRERTWGFSIELGAQSLVTIFASALTRLLEGDPVGVALELFSERYAELSTVLSETMENIQFGAQADSLDIFRLATANWDARNLVLIGDPAVRLETK